MYKQTIERRRDKTETYERRGRKTDRNREIKTRTRASTQRGRAQARARTPADLILQQQIKFEKTQAEKSIDRQVKNVKLPKLSITKFSGKYIFGLAFVLEHLRSRDRLKRAAVHVEVWLSKGTACWNRKCDLK